MTDTLWTPWRMDYILGPKPDGCVFCTALSEGEPSYADNLILHMGQRAFIMMNRYPYSHGHVMILPKKHVSWLEDLDKATQTELFELVVVAQSAIKKSFNPQGLNLGMNLGSAAGAGIDDHIHVHIVPRWNGDTNFMPVLADTRTMPEHLADTYRTLSQSFIEIGKSI